MAFSHYYLLIFALCILYVESADDPSAQLCNENSNITTPEITKNIDSLLTKLVQATSQCRGDVPNDECTSCIQNAAKEIKTLCPNRVDARLWYEYCFIRYNTKNFFGKVDTGYGVLYANVENVTDPETFNEALGALMYRTNLLAAAPGSKGVGTGETKLSDFVTLYALSQCTRDLSPLLCRQCLAIALGQTFCANKKGCRVIYSSCNIRYELYPFFFPLDEKLALESSSITHYMSLVRKP
ncbi:putative Gnk2-like domain-containing protein [Helianthus annuus]|nr:putative Gnk2-like domain-containing protein [Helianthus annuus]